MKKHRFSLATIWICLLIVSSTFGQNNLSVNLKAVLVVGISQGGVEDDIVNMDNIANLFIENGVTVYKFYDEKAIWNDILKVSKECNFFVYIGHGSTMGKDGNAGGLCIKPIVSSSNLIENLRLKDSALVIFKSVCYGAGSSAGDNKDIGIDEAKKRVTYYSYPFLEIGAAAYYANNFENGVYNFLKEFLSGITLQQAYLNSANKWTEVEFEESFPKDHNKSYSIASKQGGGISTRTKYTNGVKKVEQFKTPKKYLIAYVGNTEFSISKMK